MSCVSSEIKPSDHEKSFKDFMDERSKIKKNLYIKVSLFGVLLTLSSFASWLACWGYYKPLYSAGFSFIIVISVFFRVLGICIFSIVPTNEVDILKVIIGSEIYWRRFLILKCICWSLWNCLHILNYGIDTKTIIQAIPPFIISLCCIWCCFKNERRYEEFVLQVQSIFLFILFYNGLIILDCAYGYCNPFNIAGTCLIVLVFFYSLYFAIEKYRQAKPLLEKKRRDEANKKVLKQADCIADIEEERGKEDTQDHDETIDYNVSVVYSLIYHICVLVGFYNIVIGFDWAVTYKSSTRAAMWFCQALFDFIPLVIVGVMGKEFCFNLCARMFEFDVKRQQEDGAHMAALISTCQARPTDDTKNEETLWIYRNQDVKDCSHHLTVLEECKLTGEVDRKFWIKAVVEKSQEGCNYIRVDYRDDMNLKLRYLYKGVTLTTEEKLGREALDCSFTSWLKYFEKYDSQKNEELQTVHFWYPPLPAAKTDSKSDLSAREVEGSTEVSVAVSSGSKEELVRKAKDMLEWGKKNLRKFKSQKFFETKESEKRFRSSLFTTSPRDLSKWTDEDEKEFSAETTSEDTKIVQKEIESEVAAKENGLEEKDVKIRVEEKMNEYKIKWKKMKLFSLSESVAVSNRFGKIDYFISHSWVDNAEKKCHGLEAFIDRCNSSGKSPSFWLDKVCIDQNDTTKGIEALPINIGACKKVLILMGKTYMKRLWCIW